MYFFNLLKERHDMDKKKENTRRNHLKLWSFAAALLLLSMAGFFTFRSSSAAQASILVKEINYDKSTITLQCDSRDTVIYFSDSSKKKWEALPVSPGSQTVTMDISWISVSSNYTLTFKGDYSENIVSVTIPKQATNFKVSFNKQKGIVTFSNAGNRTIQWRKKGSSNWKVLNIDAHNAEISHFFTNGAQLYYRLAPVNGTGSSNPGMRASKEVSLTIPKKTAAPNISINGSRFSIPVKKGMAYRKLNGEGVLTEWTTVTSTKDLLLSDLAPELFYKDNTTGKEAVLQFRMNASSSSQVSNIATVTIEAQRPAPSEDTYGISLNYTSSSTLSLTVKAASATSPFEYTIVNKGRDLDYKTASWKAINSSSAVSISKSTAPEGSQIYIRQKAMEATEDHGYVLPSVELNLTGSSGVVYPPAAKATQLTSLISTAGVCRSDNSQSYLTFFLYSPTQTTVASIELYDAYENSKGSVPCKSTVALNTKSTGSEDKYLITTRITSTENVNSLTEEILYAHITLANQEVIRSDATQGVLLYLYPHTVVNNPTDQDYTSSFRRIYQSNDPNDAASFKFKLDFGTAKVPDPNGIDLFSSESTAISSMKFNGYQLAAGKDYSVSYGSYTKDDGSSVATATVTVNVASLEKAPSVNVMDRALPLSISLNNGELLDDDIYITLIRTATIDDIPIAWTITEGSLKEKTTSVVTNPDGSTTTTTQDVTTFTITLTLFDASYGVSVSNVTWGDASIFSSATISKGKATIYLSNAKINKLTTSSTDTKNIVITLSNGYVIDSGCKLTILNAD